MSVPLPVLARCWNRRATTACLACGLATVAFVAAALRAVRFDPLPSQRAAAVHAVPNPVRARASRHRSAVDLVRQAAAADPFRPERRAPAERFRLPGENIEQRAAAGSGSAQAALRLIGTAVTAPGQGFAMCQEGEAAPKLVRVGESFAGYTLRAVEKGRAVFRTPSGGSVALAVPKAGT
jgi:hypothetical protein